MKTRQRSSLVIKLVSWSAIVWFVCAAPAGHAGTFPAENSREISGIRNEIRAAQFLSKATFGPTKETISSLAGRIGQIGYRRACSEWIDQQFAIPMSSHQQVALDIAAGDNKNLDGGDFNVWLYRDQAWWHIVLTRDDQLRQRVAWALSQIFVIGNSGLAFNNPYSNNIGNGQRSIHNWLGMSNFHDMLARNATKTYRELLGDVTWHHNMGVYLSSYQNREADISKGRFPDENYAREIMQLFSVGLYELHQDGRLKVDSNGELIPTYDNEGIKELARLFTGFKSFHHTSTSFGTIRNFGDPMVMHASEHDNNYNYAEDPNQPGQVDPNAPPSKTVFGVTLSPLPVPLTAAAATAEVEEGLDVIANHPNVAPFICRRLIQRLVKSNPSRAYMRRVTRVFRDNGHGQRGDMKAVVKAILLDPELLRGQRLMRKRNPSRIEVVTRGTEYSRLREPVLRLSAWIRAMRPRSNYDTNDPVTGEPFMMLNHVLASDLGQYPFRAPSVFNFYEPDYQPPGELIAITPSRRMPTDALYAPEFKILTAVTSNRMANRFVGIGRARQINLGMRRGRCIIYFNLNEELELAKNNANLPEILRRFDLLLCSGSLSETSKTSIINGIVSESTHSSQAQHRLESLLNAVILSPDCAIDQ